MYCENCGNRLKDEVCFCENCGKEIKEKRTIANIQKKNENVASKNDTDFGKN